MCNSELENLTHFLLQCPACTNERNKILQIERLNTEEEEDIIGELLFKEETIKEIKVVIYEMRKKREQQRKILDVTN